MERLIGNEWMGFHRRHPTRTSCLEIPEFMRDKLGGGLLRQSAAGECELLWSLSMAGNTQDKEYDIEEAYLVPHEVVGKYGRFQGHTNALILIMSGAILEDPSVLKMGDLVDEKLRA